jgi:hypothetical protein
MYALALLLLQSRPDPEQAARMMAVVMPIIGIVVLVSLVIFIVPFWFICKKAGFSPWLSLLNLVPLGSLILLYILAFAEWRTVPPMPFPYPYPPAPPQA